MMETQTDKRKSWRCKHCGKEDRKGRLMGHILKHHVVFYRVPFSCSICSFRCNDKKTLVDHLKNYKRHLAEVADRQGRISLDRVLQRSENPYWVSQKDMEPVLGLYGCSIMSEPPTTGNAGCDEDGLFEPQKEDMLPAWLLDNYTTPSAPEPAALSTLQPFRCATSTSQGFSDTPVQVGQTQAQRNVSTNGNMDKAADVSGVVPFMDFLASPAKIGMRRVTPTSQVFSATPVRLSQTQAKRSVFTNDVLGKAAEVSGVVPFLDLLASPANIGIPSGRTSSNCNSDATPLMDESMLPELLPESDRADPLFQEIDEVPHKRARVEGTSSDETSHEDPSNVIAKAIGEASQIILTALGKSIETSEQTIGFMSDLITVMKEVQSDVRRIERKVTSLERKVEMPPPRAPMLKSVVSAANRKK
ncbi:hypothetical protein DPMN_153747 [Dreissena polymorpha]|uniref:C2H2-type domain-containing protein n=1 Tax=Dreissena polymorpha TaxID=45954 RepID=A0A9D4J6C6_DREPO|nr:hypothetical protein DPMN_153747 [Dreissena polymorpha]